MKMTVHVNLGNYENMAIESNDHATIGVCRAELDVALAAFNVPRVDDYRKRITMATTNETEE